MTYDQCPFPPGTEEAKLWQMLVFDDINAFVDGAWDRHEADFLQSEFLGLNANKSPRPQDWAPDFPTLDIYRDRWLAASRDAAARADRETLRQAHFSASRLAKITITGDLALCVKHFDGAVAYRDGTTERLEWETAYLCRHRHDRWWITGFVGFLPQ